MKTVIAAIMIVGIALVAFAGDGQVALTVYNDNLALVREMRPVKFKKGLQEIRFEEVSAQIDPTSVHFSVPSAKNAVRLLEQNFEFDLVGSARILEKYLNELVEITAKDSIHSGRLLSSQGGDIVLQQDDGKITILKSNSVEIIRFPSLPEGLITKPTLVWLLDSDREGALDSEISYLTKGLSWHAEYVAVVDENDSQLELSAWVSVDNHSGASYKNARLKLVAGDVNIIEPKRLSRAGVAASALFMAEAAPKGFEEKSFFEYHLYTLQRPTTLADRQIKQIALFDPVKTEVKKIYTFGEKGDDKVQVNLEFVNDEKHGMGMPLPKGKIRVYKNDSDGAQEFIGEDLIDHTPKKEKVRVFMGNAFDIVGEKTEMKEDKIGKRARKVTYSVELRNRKDEPVTLFVVEHLYGDAKPVGETPPVEKLTANRVEFRVDVPADSSKSVEYTILYQY